MTKATAAALAATQSIRRSRGFQALPATERTTLDRDLERIENTLRGRPLGARAQRGVDLSDPFAMPMETPADLQSGFVGNSPSSGPVGDGRGQSAAPAPRPTPRTKAPTPTEMLGERAAAALDAVDFPSFISGLVRGTFQAIVDATSQQVREYAKLVADISKSVDEFTRDNVTPNQARDYLAEKHPQDLQLVLPAPGERTPPRLEPQPGATERPSWLGLYDLGDRELTPELTEGALLNAGRRAMGEERMRGLATMVLMGVNRIVVDEGEIRAKLQFHAAARERTTAEIVAKNAGQQMGIAGRSGQMQTAVSTMVSTVNVNAQSNISLKTDLVGEVAVRFRSETFDLQRFADSAAIGLISRHAHNAELAAEQAKSAAPSPLPTEDRETTGGEA